MNNEKITHRMGSTTVTQTVEGFELKNGSGIKIPPEVTFKDVKNETVLGDPNNMHITTGCINDKEKVHQADHGHDGAAAAAWG